MEGELEVADGWRKTNLTWRPSLLDILPSLPISGDDLTAAEKKALGLPESRAAFRQDKFVHSTLKAVGLKAGDVIVGLNGKGIDGAMDDYPGPRPPRTPGRGRGDAERACGTASRSRSRWRSSELLT